MNTLAFEDPEELKEKHRVRWERAKELSIEGLRRATGESEVSDAVKRVEEAQKKLSGDVEWRRLKNRDQQVLWAIICFQQENGYSPSYREICGLTDITSTSVIYYYINRLEEMGYVEHKECTSRSVNVNPIVRARLDFDYDTAAAILARIKEMKR